MYPIQSAKSYLILIVLFLLIGCSPKLSKKDYDQIQYENQQLQKRLSIANHKLEKIHHDISPKKIIRDSFNIHKYRILQSNYEQLTARYKRATFRTKGASDCSHVEQKLQVLQTRFDSLMQVVQNMQRLKVSNKK